MESLDLSEIDLEGALRKYAAHKGWLHRATKKLKSLLEVLAASYSWELANELKNELDRAETQLSYMAQVTDWLEQQEYEHVANYTVEVGKEEKFVDKCYTDFNKIRGDKNKRDAEVLQGNRQAQAPVHGVKLMSDLKPEQLQVDSSTTDYKQWKRQFSAYFSASNLDGARVPDQHAYLESCLHKDLAKVISREATQTTPTLGENSCMSILDRVFKNKYPIILRRKSYFSMSQKSGQDERAFLEDLRATADEADIAGMSLNDALCMQLLTGLQDKRLVEKLGEVEEPNIEEFTRIVNAHMHAKASTLSQSNKTAAKPANKKGGGKQNPQQPQSSSGSRPQLSEKEQSRRRFLYNKCLRCGEQGHFIKDCTVPSSVNCNKCKSRGHIARACNAPQARAADSTQPDQLQITYSPEGEEGWKAAANMVHSAAAHSQPTPTMLL
jgi:hypothetical protein